MNLFKRSEIGIGTLIVFLATILAATIASGTIIRTAGVLQQRSYQVSSSTRDKITSFFEIISIFGNSRLSENKSIEKLNVYSKLLSSSKKILVKDVYLVLTPFNIVYCYNENSTFFNREKEINFCDTSYVNLDLNNDCVEDKISIEDGFLFWYFNETDKFRIVPWNVGDYFDENYELISNNISHGKMYLIGNVDHSECSQGVNIKVKPYSQFGHYIIEHFKENETNIINPGDTLKFVFSTPELYENQEYGIEISHKNSIVSRYYFDIPDIYEEYVRLK
ncbi:MAG: hypothetical protein QXR30_00025 [Candidatus Woesearchaeota archaeon]